MFGCQFYRCSKFVAPAIKSTNLNFYSSLGSPRKLLKSKPKIIDSLEEATIENAKPTKIRNPSMMKMNEESNKEKVNPLLNYEDVFARCLKLNSKENGVFILMGHLNYAHFFTGLPFFFLYLSSFAAPFISILPMPEMIASYFILISINLSPIGLKLNEPIIDHLKSRYPSLNECLWSRRFPDPTAQSIIQNSKLLSKKFVQYEKIEEMIEEYPFLKRLRKARDISYIKYCGHGWALDIANNARYLIMFPMIAGLMHVSGIVPALNVWWGLELGNYVEMTSNIMKYGSGYISAAYMSRILAPFALKYVALPLTEKRFQREEEKQEKL